VREGDAPHSPDMSTMNKGFDDEVLMVGSVPFLPDMDHVCVVAGTLGEDKKHA
jgi:hypothetical protein